MLDKILKDPSLCYGCGACVEACPMNCIGVTKNDYGFSEIKLLDEDNCIKCGKCERVCQIYKRNTYEDLKKPYYAQNKNLDVLKQSSSGGIVSALASYVLKNNGVVWGVRYNSDINEAEFYCVREISELYLIRGSKYMEVSKPAPYKEIEKQLIDNILVLFTGIPCQATGLKKYLGKEFENLICVDLLCYGIQSPKVWKEYLSEINPDNKKIKDISFRYKEPRWENYGIKITFEDGSCYKKNRWKDKYLLSYATPFFTRENCKNCEAKKFPRSSDITIGDFWQIDAIQNISKDINVNNGVSVIIVHSPKGESVLQAVSDYLNIFAIPEKLFVNMYARYSKNAKMPENGERFMAKVFELGFSNTVNKYVEINYFEKRRLEWLRIKRIINRYFKPLLVIINIVRGKG